MFIQYLKAALGPAKSVYSKIYKKKNSTNYIIVSLKATNNNKIYINTTA